MYTGEKIYFMSEFKLISKFKQTGDQPEAIKKLTDGFLNKEKFMTLLGVTGSGKTFTMANIIKNLNKPTLIIAPNKTLAAQLYSEFKNFFPKNAVEYFVSYYDYYQPEVYLPSKDIYIEKDASINQEIDKLRYAATAALLDRKDVIIISSVSCIYGLGDPDEYNNMILALKPDLFISHDEILKQLVNLQYTRNDYDFKRGNFRVRGDVIEIFPVYYSDSAIRIKFFGDQIEEIFEFKTITGDVIGKLNYLRIMPASYYVASKEKINSAVKNIKKELAEHVKNLIKENKALEADRIKKRTNYDIEMMTEIGFCSGIENYSRYIENRPAGSPPSTLIDYFPKDFLIIIDESHVTVPQIGAMYKGDQSRKQTLIDYGFRLPSAKDNRPLTFEEFESKINQILFVSATPGSYEKNKSNNNIVEQIIRPTGLLDPEVFIKKTDGQINDLIEQIKIIINKQEKVLITTLTKKMSESLTDYLIQNDIRAEYLHSEINAIERTKIIHDLRNNVFDVLIGINLLREGLDIPEVSLVIILDADQEGFLRSETSLIQTIGRAARNSNGKVIMYADIITKSIKKALDETNRRRAIQKEYNIKNNITPKTIKKDVNEIISATEKIPDPDIINTHNKKININKPVSLMSKKEFDKKLKELNKKMELASLDMNFELAIEYREKINYLKKNFFSS